MKNRSILYSFLAILIGACCFSACGDYDQELPVEQLKSVAEVTLDIPDYCNFTTISSIELEEAEVEMLLYVRELEKMAYDVYTLFAADERFKKPIFEQMAESEQDHMEKVLCLLIHFNIDDPALEPGEFTNDEIQDLYDDMVALGSGPISDALWAGAIIEDHDIFMINYFMEDTENDYILNVFGNIVCGSGNHLIQFVRMLKKFGIDYVPEYITTDEYQDILYVGHQNCGK